MTDSPLTTVRSILEAPILDEHKWSKVPAMPVDAVLLSGTGMPSLALLADPPASGPLLLSSNLCLTMALCRAIGLPEPDRAQWAPRLAEATASPQTQKAANA